jgi:hypothetical protein
VASSRLARDWRAPLDLRRLSLESRLPEPARLVQRDAAWTLIHWFGVFTIRAIVPFVQRPPRTVGTPSAVSAALLQGRRDAYFEKLKLLTKAPGEGTLLFEPFAPAS